jgi:hypothetical protein
MGIIESLVKKELNYPMWDTDEGSYLIRVVERSKPCFRYAKTLVETGTLRF